MLLDKTFVLTFIFVVSLFTIAKCFYIKDELMEPIDAARAENEYSNFDQQRVRRQVLGPVGGIAQPVGVIPRDQTVIVVPNSGTNAYRNVQPYASYGSSRGTSVVVSQGPGYSNVPRSIEILPVNPVMK